MEDRMTIDQICKQGCVNILCTMLRQMAKEFRAAYKSYLSDPNDYEAAKQYEEIRNEFLSERFNGLTTLNGRKIVEKLEEHVLQGIGQAA